MTLHRSCLSAICDNFNLCAIVVLKKDQKVFFSSWSAQALLHVNKGQDLSSSSLDSVALITCQEIIFSLVEGENVTKRINLKINDNTTSLEFSFASFQKYYVLINITHSSTDIQNQSIVILEEKLSAITRLSDGIAHNLRSPLMALRGISDYMIFLVAQWESILAQSCHDCLLKKDKEKTSFLLYQMRDDIKNNVVVITDIINNLRAYNKVDRENDFVKVKIIDLIQKSMKILEYNTKLAAEIIFIPPNEKIPLIYCVPSDIQVVLTNLIENAIEQIISTKTENGQVIISIKRHGKSITIKVKDNGGGIDKDIMKTNQLFEPFVTTKKNLGTGLGLHSSFKIVKEHGGNIYAKNCNSKIGLGAEFTIVLPIK